MVSKVIAASTISAVSFALEAPCWGYGPVLGDTSEGLYGWGKEDYETIKSLNIGPQQDDTRGN